MKVLFKTFSGIRCCSFAATLVLGLAMSSPARAHPTNFSDSNPVGPLTLSVGSQLLTPANNASIATSVQVKYQSDTTHCAAITNTDLVDSFDVTYDVEFHLGHGVDRDNWGIVASSSAYGNYWSAGPGTFINIPASLSTSFASYSAGTYEGQAYSYIAISGGFCSVTHYHPWTQN